MGQILAVTCAVFSPDEGSGNAPDPSFLFPAVGGLQPCLRHKCHLVSSFHWDLDLDFSGLTLLRIFLAIYLFIISTLSFLASYHGYYYCGVYQFIGFGSFSA